MNTMAGLLKQLTGRIVRDYMAQRRRDEAKIAGHLKALATLPDGRGLRGDRAAHRALPQAKFDHRCQIRWTRRGIQDDWKDLLSTLCGARLTYTDDTHDKALEAVAATLRRFGVPPPHSGKRLPAPWSVAAIRRAVYRNGGIDECKFWISRVKDRWPSTAELPIKTQPSPGSTEVWIAKAGPPTMTPALAKWLQPEIENTKRAAKRQRQIEHTRAQWAKDRIPAHR